MRDRAGRGWGPFSGGQLTIIIVTFAILLLAPVGAWAVTAGSPVYVTDSHTHSQASVNGAGALNVAGSVTATQNSPNETYNSVSPAGEDITCNAVTAKVPAGKALIVQQITIRISSVTTGPVSLVAYTATEGTPCGPLHAEDQIGVSGSGVSGTMSFPAGFPVKPGQVVGIGIGSNSGNALASVTVNGYLVPSSECTVNGPPIGCD